MQQYNTYHTTDDDDSLYDSEPIVVIVIIHKWLCISASHLRASSSASSGFDVHSKIFFAQYLQ